MKPRLIVKQKITAFVNRYEIYSATDNGEQGKLVAFAEQKRLAFKERVDFYADTDKRKSIFVLRAEKVMDVHGKYFIEDTKGNRLGAFKKEFKKSLLNSTWNILDGKDKPALVINESNQVIAILRRFLQFIPIVGDAMDLVMNFFKYHFVFRDSKGREQGRYIKTALFRDFYRLEMTDTAYDSQDWRTMAAFAVALDALQSR
jgi:uncharacterized protein YxjI